MIRRAPHPDQIVDAPHAGPGDIHVARVDADLVRHDMRIVGPCLFGAGFTVLPTVQ